MPIEAEAEREDMAMAVEIAKRRRTPAWIVAEIISALGHTRGRCRRRLKKIASAAHNPERPVMMRILRADPRRDGIAELGRWGKVRFFRRLAECSGIGGPTPPAEVQRKEEAIIIDPSGLGRERMRRVLGERRDGDLGELDWEALDVHSKIDLGAGLTAI